MEFVSNEPSRFISLTLNPIWTDKHARSAYRTFSGFFAISNALIGQSKWTEPLVRKDVNILFGKDEKAAWNFVNACRKNLLRQYKFNMQIIRELEIKYYGKNT